jgi:hypothetical protein
MSTLEENKEDLENLQTIIKDIEDFCNNQYGMIKSYQKEYNVDFKEALYNTYLRNRLSIFYKTL